MYWLNYAHCAVQPPSIVRLAPVIRPDAGDARNTIARDRETTGSVGDGTIAIATVAWSRVSAAASVREGLARGLRRAAIASRARRDAMKPPGIATVADSAVVRARTPGVDAGRPRRLVAQAIHLAQLRQVGLAPHAVARLERGAAFHAPVDVRRA